METPRDILRDSITLAKGAGLWQKFSLKEKENLIRYFYFIAKAIKNISEETNYVNTMD